MNKYESPLGSRYASEYMLELFSNEHRSIIWRKLWISLAKAEKKLGLDITDEQIKELEDNVSNIDYDAVKAREKEVRLDVMAHVYAYGLVAPKAAGIIHLGATSCYVTDNSDLVIYRDALKYVRKELVNVLNNLYKFADEYKGLPTLGYTHYQPAQLVTVGKRATLWAQDFLSDLNDLDYLIDSIVAVSGQTYSRKMDMRILNVLSGIGQSAYRMANDIRLLQHEHLLEEPFEKNQIGSSAMAYKRNPMRSERICSLSRYLMNDSLNATQTAAVQWLERTLDDSAVRRISMPEGFLCTDAILRLCSNVTNGLVVNKKIIEKTLNEYMPFIATENIMMEAVKKGKNRQEVHEVIRQASIEANNHIKEGKANDLLDILLNSDIGLEKDELDGILEPSLYIGRCVSQVDNFNKMLKPYLKDLEKVEDNINL